jgi:threonyl-tRNA synthetase
MFIAESEDRVLAVADELPDTLIYRQGIKSYRDPPLRMAEFGACTATSRRARCTV